MGAVGGGHHQGLAFDIGLHITEGRITQVETFGFAPFPLRGRQEAFLLLRQAILERADGDDLFHAMGKGGHHRRGGP